MSIIIALFSQIILISFGLCILYPNSSTVAMSHVHDKAHGSAVMSFLNMGTATVFVLCIGLFPNTLKKFDQLDAVINCAGIFRACGMENFDEAALDDLWAINTKAPVYLTHQAWSALKQSGSGRVINISSVLG